jgi:hypothetical protein
VGNSIIREQLFEVCGRTSCVASSAVVAEPYIPHFPGGPRGWNGTLVVAEAQNLSDRYREYRQALQELSRRGEQHTLWDRLNQPLFSEGHAIGIGPWDDGTIKFTVACLRGLDSVERIAVSNAVVWSASEGGASEHLRHERVEASVGFWKDLLQVLCPKEILAFGATAANVMRRTGYPTSQILALPGPFGRTLQIGFKMDTGRLFEGFPEVAEKLEPAREAFSIENELLAIHCACASISRMLDRKE